MSEVPSRLGQVLMTFPVTSLCRTFRSAYFSDLHLAAAGNEVIIWLNRVFADDY
jgi:hypothetical protein